MASQQPKKGETPSQEPKVSKLAHHYEILADQAKVSNNPIGDVAHVEVAKETHPSETTTKETQGGTDQRGEHSHTLDDIGKYRAQAQQNSMEAIRGAEERYAKAKESALSSQKDANQPAGQGQKVQELSSGQGGQQGYTQEGQQGLKATGGEKVGGLSSHTDVKQHHGGEGREEGTGIAGQGAGYATAAKDTIVSVGKTVIDYTTQAVTQAKDVAVSKGTPAVQYIGEKTMEVGKNVAGYTGEKAAAAKDTTLEYGKSAAGYTGEKAVQAKDTTLEVGKKAAGTTIDVTKSAASYAGSKAAQAKDVALETGLRAAHYTLDKAVQVTEATADVGRRAVGVTGEKVETTKEDAAQKEHESNKAAAEMKKASQGEVKPKFDEYAGESEMQGTKSETQGTTKSETQGTKGGAGGGLMSAVGETLVEIAQSTKNLVIGDEPGHKE